MLSRLLRATLIGLLIVVAAGAGLVFWQNQRLSDDLSTDEAAVQAALARLTDTVWAVGAGQQAYVVPGQTPGPWFEQVSLRVQALYDALAEAAPLVRSEQARGYLERLTAGADALLASDVRVRELLRADQDLMAADVIMGDGRATAEAMAAEILAFADAERAAFTRSRRGLARATGVALSTAGGLWLGGLLLLTWRSRPPAAAPAPQPLAAPPLDLDAVAETAAALARVTSADALPGAIDRARAVLEASGVVLWMGAGDELFPAVTSGYPPKVARRLRPLRRQDDNATVGAWTTGRVRAVAGGAGANGAVVAPLFGLEGPIGVLAAELTQGRERDPGAQAAVAMLAAQLAGIVPAWPRPSVREAAPAPPAEPVAPAGDAERAEAAAGADAADSGLRAASGQ